MTRRLVASRRADGVVRAWIGETPGDLLTVGSRAGTRRPMRFTLGSSRSTPVAGPVQRQHHGAARAVRAGVGLRADPPRQARGPRVAARRDGPGVPVIRGRRRDRRHSGSGSARSPGEATVIRTFSGTSMARARSCGGDDSSACHSRARGIPQPNTLTLAHIGTALSTSRASLEESDHRSDGSHCIQSRVGHRVDVHVDAALPDPAPTAFTKRLPGCLECWVHS